MTTGPFTDQHAIIEAAQNRICEAEERIFTALADVPNPPGAISTGHDDEWDYSEQAGAYTRSLTMGRWQPAGDGSGRVRAEVALSVEQAETGALREWSIYLAGNGLDGMTADDARQVAAALLDAAAALEASQGFPSDRDDHHLDDHHLDDHHLDDHHLDDHHLDDHHLGDHHLDDHHLGDPDRDDHHLGDPDRDDHHLDDPAGGATIEAGQSPDSEPVA